MKSDNSELHLVLIADHDVAMSQKEQISLF
jgi:hypothetical protein